MKCYIVIVDGKMRFFFVTRERYSKEKWGYRTPQDKKLTDQEVTDFVQCIQPIILHSMYCKVGFSEMGTILQVTNGKLDQRCKCAAIAFCHLNIFLDHQYD
jgi:hypothetical protein